MKVLALVILVVGTTTGLGSGPYLPSGWKPAGPAFYLPTEVEKPVVVALKDVPVEESESSGSSFLREYGPPDAQVQVEETIQEVSQDITQQALPEPITEQAFVVIEAKSVSDNEENAEINQETVTEQVTETASETESQNVEDQTTESAALVEDAEVESQTESSLAAEEVTEQLAEVNEAAVEEAISARSEVSQQDSENSNSDIVAAFEQKSVEISQVKAVEEGVKSIEDALTTLENEIKAQIKEEEASEVKSIQGSSQNAPEGFLEYGPPGFTEYGPPKGVAKVTQEKLVSSNEINEARRRRFSPKFRTPKRKN
ncbi:hypothetical protein NE865_09070 [Phthorimaea operculella]|nr:hypothetical protein NE865_09070 [Phthorimaea operculella]